MQYPVARSISISWLMRVRMRSLTSGSSSLASSIARSFSISLMALARFSAVVTKCFAGKMLTFSTVPSLLKFFLSRNSMRSIWSPKSSILRAFFKYGTMTVMMLPWTWKEPDSRSISFRLYWMAISASIRAFLEILCPISRCIAMVL